VILIRPALGLCVRERETVRRSSLRRRSGLPAWPDDPAARHGPPHDRQRTGGRRSGSSQASSTPPPSSRCC
jgi:hypothetical protein